MKAVFIAVAAVAGLVLVAAAFNAASMAPAAGERALDAADVSAFLGRIQGAWQGEAIITPIGPRPYDISFAPNAAGEIEGAAEPGGAIHTWAFHRDGEDLKLRFLFHLPRQSPACRAESPRREGRRRDLPGAAAGIPLAPHTGGNEDPGHARLPWRPLARRDPTAPAMNIPRRRRRGAGGCAVRRRALVRLPPRPDPAPAELRHHCDLPPRCVLRRAEGGGITAEQGCGCGPIR